MELKEDSADFGQREANHVKENLLTRSWGVLFCISIRQKDKSQWQLLYING